MVEQMRRGQVNVGGVEELSAGQVGYLTASIKRVADAKVGDTITEALRPTAVAYPGYRDAKPMVFAGLYPIEDTDYEALRDALEKLRLNDPAFNFEPETSLALGYGFRCGFLGMLHREIIQQRLERFQGVGIAEQLDGVLVGQDLLDLRVLEQSLRLGREALELFGHVTGDLGDLVDGVGDLVRRVGEGRAHTEHGQSSGQYGGGGDPGERTHTRSCPSLRHGSALSVCA